MATSLSLPFWVHFINNTGIQFLSHVSYINWFLHECLLQAIDGTIVSFCVLQLEITQEMHLDYYSVVS